MSGLYVKPFNGYDINGCLKSDLKTVWHKKILNFKVLDVCMFNWVISFENWIINLSPREDRLKKITPGTFRNALSK